MFKSLSIKTKILLVRAIVATVLFGILILAYIYVSSSQLLSLAQQNAPIANQFFTPLFMILMLGAALFIRKIGRRQELQAWLDTAREPLPAWVEEGKLKPASLYDHLNLPALKKKAKAANFSTKPNYELSGKQQFLVLLFFCLLVIPAVMLMLMIMSFNLSTSPIDWLIIVAVILVEIAILVHVIKDYDNKKRKEPKKYAHVVLGQALSNLPQANDATLILGSAGLSGYEVYSYTIFPFQIAMRLASLGVSIDTRLYEYLLVGAMLFTITFGLWLANVLKLGKAKLAQTELNSLFGSLWLLVAGFTLVGLAVEGTESFLAPQIPQFTYLIIMLTTVLRIAKYVGLLFGLFYVVNRWLVAKTETGNYEVALARLAYGYNLLSTSSTSQMQITTLIIAGRLNEAEYHIQGSLINFQNQEPSTTASFLELLGIVRLRQERYAESMFLLESAIELAPNQASIYNNLAEVYLSLHQYSTRALELTEQSLAIGISSKRGKADKLINQAWAYAQMEQTEKADKYIKKAFKSLGNKPKATFASFHYRTADMMSLRGNTAQANYHYEMAIVLDPNGFYGMQAKELLTT